MSAMKMHYSTATPPSFPVPRNLFFSNLDEVRRPSTPHNGHYAHASPRPAEAALVWPPGGEGSHNKGAGVAGGVGGSSPPTSQQAAPQGLVHWMSVMAEHMNNPHHEAVHYMWNGVENQSYPMVKSESPFPVLPRGFPSKMNATPDQNNSSPMHKALPSPRRPMRDSDKEDVEGWTRRALPYGLDWQPPEGHPNNLDDRLDGRGLEIPHNMAPASLYARSNGSASSASPPTVSTPSMLIVPQPINAAKMPPTPPGIGQNPPNNGSARKYQCKMCPQIFGSKADLQLHTQIHMREAKPYKCSQCSKAFANSSYLSQHTRIHLGIKPYRCEICQRKFTQLSHLQQHIRTHTGDKPYKCRHPGCNKAFSQLSNLQSHSRCHQTDKPYKCNSCYKCFADEASLLEHIPKHKESKHLKTHICQYCGKSYTQETYLQKHMQKHAERPDKRPSLTAHGIRQDNPYWSKPDTALEAMDSRMSETCLQNSLDPTRHLVSREHLDHRPEELRHTPAHMPASNMSYDAIATKTSSAFTPIQTSMLPISGGTQLSMASSSQRYFPYEPISFPKTHTQMPSMDVKPNQFPNQLISLHQIRNYAHQPTMSSDLLLKDKGVTQ